MTIYCIIDPTGEPIPATASDNARSAWIAGILRVYHKLDVEVNRTYQASMERDGYRLGRATGVVFERVG